VQKASGGPALPSINIVCARSAYARCADRWPRPSGRRPCFPASGLFIQIIRPGAQIIDATADTEFRPESTAIAGRGC